MKTGPMGAESFHAHRQTDGRTDMKKVIITFPNFANASKNNEDRNIINVQRSSCRVFVI